MTRKHFQSRETVQAVIDLCAESLSLPEIAERFNLPRETIWRMIRGKYYPDMACESYVKFQGTPKVKLLTNEQAYQIRCDHQAGTSISQLARQYNIDNNTIRQILTGKTYPDAGGTLGILSFNPYTPDMVDAIRRDYQVGVPTWELEEKYQLDNGQIMHALKFYKEASEPPLETLRPDRNPEKMKISQDEREAIRQYYHSSNVTLKQIADAYGVDISYISLIVKGKR